MVVTGLRKARAFVGLRASFSNFSFIVSLSFLWFVSIQNASRLSGRSFSHLATRAQRAHPKVECRERVESDRRPPLVSGAFLFLGLGRASRCVRESRPTRSEPADKAVRAPLSPTSSLSSPAVQQEGRAVPLVPLSGRLVQSSKNSPGGSGGHTVLPPKPTARTSVQEKTRWQSNRYPAAQASACQPVPRLNAADLGVRRTTPLSL